MNPEEITAKVVEACVPLAQPGTRFVSIVPGTYIECPTPSILGFTVSAQVSPEAVFEAYVQIKIPIPDEDVFDGIVEIRTGGAHSPEFYWTLAGDVVQATPIPVMRRRGELAQAVRTNLNALGYDVDGVRTKLVWLGYEPNLSGLNAYIAAIFGLKNVKIELVSRYSSQVPQITANRPGSDVTLLLKDDFSIPMEQFLTQELQAQ